MGAKARMDEAGKKELWDLYAKNKSGEIREKIIAPLEKLRKRISGANGREYSFVQCKLIYF